MSVSVDATPRQVWFRLRGPLVIVGILVLGGVVLAILQGRTTGGPLDPQSARQGGARALAVLLGDQGVEVQRVRTLDEALAAATEGSTLLVTQPDLLAPVQVRRLNGVGARHLVFFEPGEEVLDRFAPGVVPAGTAIARVRGPGCDLRAATRAGAVHTDGSMYRAVDTDTTNRLAVTCYGDGTRGAVVRLTAPDRTVDVVGTPLSLTNAELGEQGHAALGLNLLGDHPRLVWYVPSLSDLPRPGEPGGPSDQQSLFSLLPDGIRFGVVQAAVAVGLLMLAQARRIGPVVPEALPVVVRASEAVEGRARLYRRAHARDQAAAGLRAATRVRIIPLLGLPVTASDQTVVAAVAARTGRPGTEVAGLLGAVPAAVTAAGPATEPAAIPADAALVRLADDLDTLEQEVRRT